MNNAELKSIRVDMRDPFAEVVLIGPSKGNAMGPDFWSECPAVFDWLDKNDKVRAIVLRGSTGNFSFGLDLLPMGAEMAPLILGAPSAAQREKLLQLVYDLQEAFNAVARCRKPVIASISGWCIGGGVDLIAAADVRLCSARVCCSSSV